MSATAATARYVITADDKTKAAIASAHAGFRAMESGIRGTVRRMNLALGVLGGVTLKRAFQNIFTETAKGSKEFAFALDEARRAARSLLASKEGVPAATEAMRELAAVLKDPDVVRAADAITTVFIRGAAETIKFAFGVKTLRDEIDQLKRERDALEKQEGLGSRRNFIKGEPTFATDKAEQIARVSSEIAKKEQELAAQEAAEAERRTNQWARIMEAGNRATRRFNTMEELKENIRFLEELEKASDALFKEQQGRDIAGIKARTAFFDQMDEAARDVGDTLKRTGDDIDGVANRMEAAMERAKLSQVFVEAFQESLFGNVSGLIQSAGEGWDDFADQAINSFKRLLADRATLELFNFLAGMGGKSGGGLFSFLGGLLGVGGGSTGAGTGSFSGPRASGGPVSAGRLYSVNEREMEFFRPNVGGEVIPLSKGGMRSAPASITVINNNTFNNMRDVSDAKLQVAGKQISDITIGRIRELQRQGQF